MVGIIHTPKQPMRDDEWPEEDTISFLFVGTMLLRNRWRILKAVLIAGLAAAGWTYFTPPKYVASTSFLPQANDPGRSGLASLAGQFGVSLPTGDQSLSPEFYSSLLKSRVVLARIAQDTFRVPEISRPKATFLDLFKISRQAAPKRIEKGVRLLQDRIVNVSVAKATGVVDVSVKTNWPSVSLAIAEALLQGVNEFNQVTRQSQAAAERKFLEGRLGVAATDLRAAEDRLEYFLKTNRDIGSSAELTFSRERLQRDLGLKQQVFTSLTQAYEDVRLREVRDTPVITIVEPPSVAPLPESRGLIKWPLFAMVLVGFFTAIIAYVSEMMARRRAEGDENVAEFEGTLRDIRTGIAERLAWRGRRG